MPTNKPVALILFSNDMDNFLSKVEEERKVIEEALEHFDDNNRLKVIARSSVSIEEVFRLFNRYKGRIAIFHFAGHAGGKGLQLNHDIENIQEAKAGGLANLFQQEVENGILQLVFLNGCSTHPQVERLKEVGVPSIISTYRSISDNKAVRFAQQFYQCLANTAKEQPFENLPSIDYAFKRTIAWLKTSYDIEEEINTRDFVIEFRDEKKSEPWTLYTKQPDWQLNFDIAHEKKVYNEVLTLQLMEAIQEHIPEAGRLLARVAQKQILEWETIGKIADRAKSIITRSYVGVLGIQLRKLFAIGKEAHSPQNQRKYLQNCLLTCKRALQLICFTMLSRLWDHQKETQAELPERYRDPLRQFFESEFEHDIKEYAELIDTLLRIFEHEGLALPLEGMQAFKLDSADKKALDAACSRLQDFSRKLDKQTEELADCFAAERQLAMLLKTLHFLAAYRMVSIKNIVYDEMRNSPPKYLHSLATLGIDLKDKVNGEAVKYVDTPINTDAVLLYKGGIYQQKNINLFPFIIDYNALTIENGTKICFYQRQDFNDESLYYSFLEDNHPVNIAYKQTWKEGDDLNVLMMDAEKRVDYKLDFVWLQFQEMKKALLGDNEFGF